MYDITKKMCNEQSRNMVIVKSKNGEVISKEHDINRRWREHFEQILNRDDPLGITGENEQCEELDINVDTISNEEIKSVL